MVVFNDQLIVSGSFMTVDGTVANTIACWDGSSWRSIKGHLSGDLKTLAVQNGELVAGGSLNYGYITHYGPTCLPGDMNCDGVVDQTDVPLFVDELLWGKPDTDCAHYLANAGGDVLDDGTSKVDGADIAPFVAALMERGSAN